MKHLVAVVVASCLASLAVAQSMTCTVASSGLLQATLGTQVATTLLPAGGSAPSGYGWAETTQPWGLAARAWLTWQVRRTPSDITFRLENQVQVFGPGSAVNSPGDFLLQLHSTAAVPVRLELERNYILVAGMPMPTVLVDVGDDGTPELDSSLLPGIVVPVSVPPGTVNVRVRAQMSIGSSGGAVHQLFVRTLPARTQVHELGFGCVGPGLTVRPLFSGDVAFFDLWGTTNPWLVVVGGGLHPVPLPGPWPLCLLVPTPDLVLFAPGAPSLTLAMPAALRRFDLFAQGMLLTPLGLGSSSAFSIQTH